jgi:hypothetical protein
VLKNLRLLAAVVVMGLLGFAVPAQSQSITLQLFPLTGEVRLLNEDLGDFSFVAYRIDSPSGGLNGADGVWTSIADTYDAPTGPTPGNGFITMTNEWLEFPPTPMVLAEGVAIGPAGALPEFRAISLGKIWDPSLAPPNQITAQVAVSNNPDVFATVNIELAVDGDYSGNLSVGDEDYGWWSGQAFGTTYSYFADGNLNGIVDAADYTTWRDNLGDHYTGPGLGSSGGGSAGVGLRAAAVPEPHGIALTVVALSLWPRMRRIR